MNSEKIYGIAGHRWKLEGAGWQQALEALGGFRHFLLPADGTAVPDFIFRAGTGIPPFRQILYTFQYEDIRCRFGQTAEGVLLELCPADEPRLCCWTEGDAVFLAGHPSPRLLRFALWMGYGFQTVRKDTVALHSSCIVYRGKAVLFLGESGTGKSTHTRLWSTCIEGSELLNDDSPVVRCGPDGIRVYGSPWSGKTPCYKCESYPLAGCVRLVQAPSNRMERLPVVPAFAALHPSAPPAFAYCAALYDGVCHTLSALLAAVPVFRLYCRPDEEAARLACRTLFPGDEP